MRSGRCSVSEWLTALCSRSGATTTTSPSGAQRVRQRRDARRVDAVVVRDEDERRGAHERGEACHQGGGAASDAAADLGRASESGRADLNGRPLAPQASALPGCATPRRWRRLLGARPARSQGERQRDAVESRAAATPSAGCQFAAARPAIVCQHLDDSHARLVAQVSISPRHAPCATPCEPEAEQSRGLHLAHALHRRIAEGRHGDEPTRATPQPHRAQIADARDQGTRARPRLPKSWRISSRRTSSCPSSSSRAPAATATSRARRR